MASDVRLGVFGPTDLAHHKTQCTTAWYTAGELSQPKVGPRPIARGDVVDAFDGVSGPMRRGTRAA